MRRVLNLYNYGSGSKKALAIRLTIGLVVCLALGWLVSRGVSWEEVWQSFRDLPLHLLALALVVFLLSNVARAYRWQVLFIDERISVRRLFLIENMGLGLNNVLPVRIASEATQLALLIFRDGISRGTALATLGMTRIMDVWASTLLLALGLFLVPGGGQLGRYAAGGIAFSILLLVLVRFMAWGSRGIPFVERFPVLRTFAVSLAQLERNKARMLVSMIASLSQWGILGVSGWIIALGMNVDLSLAEAGTAHSFHHIRGHIYPNHPRGHRRLRGCDGIHNGLLRHRKKPGSSLCHHNARHSLRPSHPLRRGVPSQRGAWLLWAAASPYPSPDEPAAGHQPVRVNPKPTHSLVQGEPATLPARGELVEPYERDTQAPVPQAPSRPSTLLRARPALDTGVSRASREGRGGGMTGGKWLRVVGH